MKLSPLIDMDIDEEKLVSSPKSDVHWSPRRKHPHAEMPDSFSDAVQAYSMNIEMQEPITKMDEIGLKAKQRNPCLGYTFMIIAVFGLTFGHISSKIAFERSPTLTNVDWITFFGFWLTAVYFLWSRMLGVSLQINDLPSRPLSALLASLVATVLCNLLLFRAISIISVGKSTLVFSTNPMFAMILASFLLNEHISKLVVASTLGAFIGIYFLTINKHNVNKEEHVILGFIFVILSAWFQALVFVLVRMISVHKIHFVVRPFYVGITFLLFSGIITSFHRSAITFELYDMTDIITLSCVGLGSCLWIGPLTLAMQYEDASKLSPILYIENIFTLLADVLLFKYKFVIYDYLGIGVIVLWLIVPVVFKAKKWNN